MNVVALVEWRTCPGDCGGRTVQVRDGLVGVHLVKREAARFPKLQSECSMSGRPFPVVQGDDVGFARTSTLGAEE